LAFQNPFSDAALAREIGVLGAQIGALTIAVNAMQAQLRVLTTQGATLMSTANLLDQQITALQTAVQNETSVEQSAITLINGIPKLIADAVAKAQAAGATPAELSALTALQSQIASNGTALAAAVTANTPAATA
jgi:hypothetical protein